jgi:beta-glucanase (GH16 family)
VPRTTRRPDRRHRILRRAGAAVLALGLGLGAIQVLSPADAGSTVLRQVSSASDAGVLDRNGDGVGDVAPYGLHRGSLPVGRLHGGGGDVRLVLPFRVTKAAVDAMDRGGTANVSVRVWRVDHLGGRRLTVESVGTTSAITSSRITASGLSASKITASAFSKQSSRVARLAPVQGRVAVDVSDAVRAMSRAGTLTLRLRVDGGTGSIGRPPQIAVALSEARNPSNRPVLTVTTTGGGTTTSSTPSTPPSTTAPVTPPTTAAPPTTTTPIAPPSSDEVFRDDFNGAGLDLSKWRPNWLAGTDDAVTKPVNSAELSCYDPKQVSVGGGYLHLKADARACTATNGQTYPYASGLVESAHDFTFTYGRMEARIWLPPGSGEAHNWPAFWANGTGTWPVTGELDVMEALEGHACWHFHSTAGGPGGCAPLPSPGGWHTFAADWRPGVVTYFYDGQQVGRLTSGITGSPMYLIFNLALSTEISPPVRVPSEMLVDWVKVTK